MTTTYYVDVRARFVALGFDTEGDPPMKYIAVWHDDAAESHVAVGPFDSREEAEDFAYDRIRDEGAEVARIQDTAEWLGETNVNPTNTVAEGHSEVALA